MKKTRIAHFSIPFYNGGGLVRYVKDVVELQALDPNIDYICIFNAANYSLFSNKPSISSNKYKDIDILNIKNFNPQTLLEGTRYPVMDIENKELEDVILDKLISLDINIVHFHTFFGISANLIKKIHEKNIRIIYTAHDHQPLCNKTTLLNCYGELCIDKLYSDCAKCNSNALSRKGLLLRYSSLSNYLKQFNKLKSKIKSMTVKKQNKSIDDSIVELNNIEYQERRQAFINNLNLYCDKIIYSSEISEKIYNDFGIKKRKGRIVTISNSSIGDNIKDYVVKLPISQYKFGYLGGDRPEKGYKHMMNTFLKLYNANFTEWKLFVFGQGAENILIPESISHNIIIKGHSEINLYKEFDILIVPSICPETFNFVVMEGLSNNKLIISSDIVGSADLYKGNGIITYKYGSEDDLYKEIEHILKKNSREYKVDVSNNIYTENLEFRRHYNIISDIYMTL